MCFAGMTLMHVNNRRGELERRSFLHCYLPNGFYIHQSQSIKCIAPPPPLYLTLAVIIATRESTVCVFAQPCDFWCVRRRQFFLSNIYMGWHNIKISNTRSVFFHLIQGENKRSAVFVVSQSIFCRGGAHLRLRSLNPQAARGFYSQFGLKGMA